MTPTEELIKEIEDELEYPHPMEQKPIVALLQQAVARLRELEREKEAYREVALELQQRYDSNHFLVEREPGRFSTSDHEITAMAQRIMKEKSFYAPSPKIFGCDCQMWALPQHSDGCPAKEKK